MKTVSAKELKNRTGEVLRRVRRGETVVVTVRGVRVARFIPERAGARVRQPDRKLRYAVVRSIVGKYEGLGTVEEFLKEKARDLASER